LLTARRNRVTMHAQTITFYGEDEHMATQTGTVVGVFHDREQARQAVSQLRRAGFRDDQIGVLARDASDRDQGDDATGTHAEEGAIAGLAGGAGLGALWGLGIAAGILPAIGPVIAGGTLAAILASAAAGAAAAGIAGALIGAGIPEEEAKQYEREFHAGRTLVTVKARGREAEARAILDAARSGRSAAAPSMQSSTTGAASTAAMSAAATPSGAACDIGARGASSTAENQTMELREERLRVDKQPVETGEVRLRKEVVTEHKTVDVPVTREEVVIERHPVAGGQATASDLNAGEEIRVPVREEQVRVEKQAVVKEEVSLGKRKVTDTQTVDENVRHEELRVDKTGKVDVRGDENSR
jgi:uncharacterized protein (TIGR02271 family)